jgi:hypothetical protein
MRSARPVHQVLEALLAEPPQPSVTLGSLNSHLGRDIANWPILLDRLPIGRLGNAMGRHLWADQSNLQRSGTLQLGWRRARVRANRSGRRIRSRVHLGRDCRHVGLHFGTLRRRYDRRENGWAMSFLRRVVKSGVVAFNRNPWISVWPAVGTTEGRWYHFDGLWTKHAQPFLDDPFFQQAYARAVAAAGWDYRIPWRLHTVLWAAAQCEDLDGDFVECGTGRGFMASGICEYLGWVERPFYLFDTFLSSSPDMHGHQEGGTNPYYATSRDATADNFREWPGVELVIGRIPDTLDTVAIERVAFLHVDLNHPDAEEAAVRYFWPRLVPNATMIYDDYGFTNFESSRLRADKVAAELGFRILALPTGQGLVIKS